MPGQFSASGTIGSLQNNIGNILSMAVLPSQLNSIYAQAKIEDSVNDMLTEKLFPGILAQMDRQAEKAALDIQRKQRDNLRLALAAASEWEKAKVPEAKIEVRLATLFGLTEEQSSTVMLML